jgi:hypothetical protein
MGNEQKAEKLFDEVTDWLAKEIPKAVGDAKKEEAMCKTAVERYAEAKRLVDPEGAFENVTHFFGVDGVGWENEREPALQRVKNLAANDKKRIVEKLGAIAMKMESDSLKR